MRFISSGVKLVTTPQLPRATWVSTCSQTNT